MAAVDAVGCGDRLRSAAEERDRAELRRVMRAGEPVDEIFESFIGPLVEKAVPDWRTALGALLKLPEVGGPVGYSGWMALGIRLAAVEPEARRITVPLLMLLQWDDEGNPRQRALDLFDAFASKEKTLHANPGGHTGTPWFELEDGNRFFDRHLK
ncbi:hypothetical protein SLINC_3602 [Streptomyces lincolnensis]|uniref:Uncharacterized protein n=1 Tax=Streptomyces lincolnensis TaxID=1915 RepID=A0A1B1MB15_STRLN|nr:hypothetical protein SLINC_3602 [Streptomyces lincolnensis]AXG54411.1 hypothetical protein SLCG_3256 [Streptomyces lincolnensis]